MHLNILKDILGGYVVKPQDESNRSEVATREEIKRIFNGKTQVRNLIEYHKKCVFIAFIGIQKYWDTWTVTNLETGVSMPPSPKGWNTFSLYILKLTSHLEVTQKESEDEDIIGIAPKRRMKNKSSQN